MQIKWILPPFNVPCFCVRKLYSQYQLCVRTNFLFFLIIVYSTLLTLFDENFLFLDEIIRRHFTNSIVSQNLSNSFIGWISFKKNFFWNFPNTKYLNYVFYRKPKFKWFKNIPELFVTKYSYSLDMFVCFFFFTNETAVSPKILYHVKTLRVINL